MISRVHIFLILPLLTLLLTACGQQVMVEGEKTVSGQPNILFIMSDDHTTQGVGAYGGRLAVLDPTPNIDALARDGALFDHVFCTNSICTPSRGNIMTGQYSQTNGIYTLDDTLPPARQYLPIEMKKLGYQTAMVGKWHLKAEPATYDYYQVLPGQGKYFDPKFRSSEAGVWPNNLVSYEGHSTDIITDITLDWLKNKRKADQPFFLMHHYKAPHDDFEFAPRYADYLEDREIPRPANLYDRNQPDFGSEATRGRNDSLRNRIGTSVSDRHPYRSYTTQYEIETTPRDSATAEAHDEYVRRFLRCVKGVDDNLGRLFAYLKEEGLWENTVIIYTGDQGFMLGEHDFMDKRWMYDESMRMPFIVHYPPAVRPGTKIDLLINNTDFAPTMLNLAGGGTPDYMQGRSFAKYLDGSAPGDWRDATYYRYWMHLTHHDVPAHFGIRTKQYKLIFYYAQPYRENLIGTSSMWWQDDAYPIEPTPVAWEFYDLEKDPAENVNRYRDPAYQDIIHKLKDKLRKQRTRYRETDDNFPRFDRVIEAYWDA